MERANIQGQGSTSNSSSNIFNVDHEPNDNSLGLEQQNQQHVVLPDASLHSDSTVTGWMGQSRFGENIPTPSFQEFLGEARWFPSTEAHPRTGQRSEERHPPTNGQAMLQGSGFGLYPRSIDLNATYEGNSHETTQDMGAGLSLQPFNPSEPDGEQNPLTTDSSNALVISSGITGYVLEENDGSRGLLSNGRRLSCKRKAPEVASRPLYLGESSSSAQTNPLDNHPNVGNSERLDTGLVIGLQAASAIRQTSSLAGQAENFQRNIRMRRTANQQDFAPSSSSMWTQGNSSFQPPSQPAVVWPSDRYPSSSSSAGIVCAPPAMQSRLQDANSSQTLQPSQIWNGANMGDSWHQEENRRNNQRNMMLPPQFERGNMARIATNLTLGNVYANSPGNIASTSQASSSSGVHQPSVPYWFPQPAMAEQYAQRVSGQGNYCPIHSGASAASRELESSIRGGNAIASQIPLMARAEEQAGANPETSDQRRSRLVSEVRSALALVRRGGALQIEDVMLIGGSVLYGLPEERGRERVRERGRERGREREHDDMRLDVDNMSYEEILALEEHIGNVCTGLSEEAILAHMRREKYQSVTVETPVEEDEPCCICQEEYADGEDLGKLDCNHDFHFDCIKQWLSQKNSCPICKMTGLAMRER